MRLMLLVALMVGMGCSGAGPESEPERGTTPEEVDPGSPDPAEPEPPSEPGEPGAIPEPELGTPEAAPVCERARSCCRAYVAAIPSARRPLEERGCTEMDAVLGEAGEASDDVCEAAIGGWRQSLQLTGLEVPEACR